ncbi:MAG: LacI family DNA-binding transcriptional regulator [Propionivibrio sp.]
MAAKKNGEEPVPVVPAQPGRRVRARLTDIARESGVSTATVDRVLNHRPGVRHATVLRVLRTASELDYLPENASYCASATEPMKLIFLLPSNSNAFIRMLGDCVAVVQRILEPFNIDCHVRFIAEFSPEIQADQLMKYGKKADGIAFIALEHPLVRETVKKLVKQGKYVLTLVNDLSSSMRHAFVGLDNHAAGRTAGYLMGRLAGNREGKVVLIAGSLSYRAHHEREMGFQQVQQEMFPRLHIVGLREGREDAVRTYELTRDLLKQHSDLIGIYNIGGACDGVARAMKEAKVERKVIFIGHEITSMTRSYLIDGSMDAVINQNAQVEIMNAVRIFTNLRDKKAALAGIEDVRIGVFVRENLP